MTQEQQQEILFKANELLSLLVSVFPEIPLGIFFNGACDVETALIKLLKNQSADACRSPVQSADVVGQGSTF